MAGHVDIIDYHERYRNPLLGSVALHFGVVGALVGYSYLMNHGRLVFGSEHPGGGMGSTVITPVNHIPLPSRSGQVNPVANDTQSHVPAPPPKPKVAEKAPKEDPKAISIKGKRRPVRQAEVAASQEKYRPSDTARPNQVYSNAGQAAVSPYFSATTSSGSVGAGEGGPFGNRFGWYAKLLQDKIARAWRTNEVDSRLHSAPTVIVTFDLSRDGSVKNVQILQRSGNYPLDTSAQRAILEAAPFPPLPPQYERDSARVEFWFELKR